MKLDKGRNRRGAAAAPSKGEGKKSHKRTDSGSGDRTKIGFVFDAPSLAFPVPQNTNGEYNKKTDGGF